LGRQAVSGDVIAGSVPGSGAGWRVDPFALPGRFTAAPGGVIASIVLHRHQVVIERSVAGVAMAHTVAVRAYEGIVVRFEAYRGPGADDGFRAIVELRHTDPRLTVPVAIASEPADIAADWQAFARQLGLPMLLERADGRLEPALRQTGQLVVAETKPRRRHSFFADRRPRFLVRRKVGRTGGPSERLTGRELIARR